MSIRIPQNVSDKLQPLDRERFEKLRTEKLRPQFNLDGLNLMRSRAQRERDLKELYRNRAPYELLQNANDVHARKTIFILSREGVAFVHDGIWFTVDNFRSLAEGWSDKDPKECIGHKGLGFRSVLDITPAPHILKVDPKDFLAIKFSWALNNGHIHKTLDQNPSLRSDYDDWTKYGQMCCPVMYIPGLVKKKHNLGAASAILDAVVQKRYGDQFTTMFWFPATDPDIDKMVLKDLGPMPIVADQHGRKTLLEFLKNEVSILLPFLTSVEEIKVYENDRCIGSVCVLEGDKKQKEGEITVLTEVQGHYQRASFFQMRFAFDIPFEIHNKPDTPKALKYMDKVSITLLVRLENGQPIHDMNSRFHVYFPTEESTGVGFIVHGDFYVNPDRKRFMFGDYNQWLLNAAAKKTANEFLTQLLQRYHARSVFTSLSLTGSAPSKNSAAENFVSLFSKALQERIAPFIPTTSGLLKREEVVLPPTIDKAGFWDAHFSDIVGDVINGKKAFLLPEVDGERTRTFMSLAQVKVHSSETLINFIEVASQKDKEASWWYDCYSYMATEDKLFRHDHSFFAGCKLIPITDSSVIAVPEDNSLIVCLSPSGDFSSLRVPTCFSRVFVFIETELAQFLHNGKDTVRSWVLDRFRISRFEATDFLPRAIRRVVQQLFSGELKITPAELREAWSFIRRISRGIVSPIFWQDVGRFPLPLDITTPDGTLKPESLIPAFLLYWPDSFIEGENCLSGLSDLRRIDEKFLSDLIAESGASHRDWIEFFGKVGVSATPKLLKYSRIVAKRQQIPFISGALEGFEKEGFSGERQSDENRVIIDTLQAENLWDETIANASSCSHNFQRVLQSLTLFDGLSLCVQMAEKEHQSGNDNWHKRLWALLRKLPISSLSEEVDDTAFCPGGKGVHSIAVGSYLQKQLNRYRWLPSSHGPASNSECFARLSSRHLISSGTTSEELGDKLLPYVVVDSIDDLARLQHLGVEVLDDATSASPSALIRALHILGDRLSTELSRNEILNVRSRWRLVRGAIQEIYRCLNQSQTAVHCPSDIKFATRSPEGVKFLSPPLYYAEPGSAVEQAFLGILPLFDADRPYKRLFQQISVNQLIPGQTVKEIFLAEETSVPATRLRDEIVNNLAPFLLAPIIARSEKSKQSELILRRLRERFEVKTANRLTVSFSLIGNPSIERLIDFPKFYLQRHLISSPGAIQEAHYILYVEGSDSISLSVLDLDADALGEALAPVFLEGIGEELAGLFPRIASRYHHLQGKREAMKEFMHYQLGISNDAQDTAWAMVSGEAIEAKPISVPPPPPPAKMISTGQTNLNKLPGDKQSIEENIRRHQEELGDKTNSLMQVLVTHASSKSRQTSAVIDSVTVSTVRKTNEITPQQKDRGRKGEKEIKRRLELPGGWEGFNLVADKTDSESYDFLCNMSGRTVKLEVKTFTQDGRIFLSIPELQEAAASQYDYYLIGVLDDGKPEHQWSTFIIRNPINTLLMKGEFDIQPKLQASADDVFNLDKNNQSDSGDIR